LVIELLASKSSEDADGDDVTDSRLETLPLCSRLQTTKPTSQMQWSIPVDDLWTYLAHQKTIGCRDLKAEYEVYVHSVLSLV